MLNFVTLSAHYNTLCRAFVSFLQHDITTEDPLLTRFIQTNAGFLHRRWIYRRIRKILIWEVYGCCFYSFMFIFYDIVQNHFSSSQKFSCPLIAYRTRWVLRPGHQNFIRDHMTASLLNKITALKKKTNQHQSFKIKTIMIFKVLHFSEAKYTTV